MKKSTIALISLVSGLMVALPIMRDLIPGPWYAFVGLTENTTLMCIGCPRIKRPTTKELVGKVMGELRAMRDDELTSISNANRPCASHLFDCRDLSEMYVRHLAAAELERRAKEKENSFKERSQKTADEALLVQQRNAEANQIAAEAQVRNVQLAERNLWIAGCSAGAAVATVIFAAISWWSKRRKKKAILASGAPPSIVAPGTSAPDAVDGSSTGTEVPIDVGAVEAPRCGGAKHAGDYDDRPRHRQVGVPSSWD